MEIWLIFCGAVVCISLFALGAKAREVVYRSEAKAKAPRDNAATRAVVYQAKQARQAKRDAIRVAPGEVRVTDAERDAAVAELAAARESGALDAAEFDDRMSRAMEARVRQDLDRLLSDLP